MYSKYRLLPAIVTTVAVNSSPRIDPISEGEQADELRSFAVSAILDQKALNATELMR